MTGIKSIDEGIAKENERKYSLFKKVKNSKKYGGSRKEAIIAMVGRLESQAEEINRLKKEVAEKKAIVKYLRDELQDAWQYD